MKLRHLVTWFTPVNGSLSTVRIEAKFYNISLICETAKEQANAGVDRSEFFEQQRGGKFYFSEYVIVLIL